MLTNRNTNEAKTLLRPEPMREKSELDFIEEVDAKKASIAKRKQDEQYTSEAILQVIEAATTREEKVEILRRAIQYVPWNQLQYARRNATRGNR